MEFNLIHHHTVNSTPSVPALYETTGAVAPVSFHPRSLLATPRYDACSSSRRNRCCLRNYSGSAIPRRMMRRRRWTWWSAQGSPSFASPRLDVTLRDHVPDCENTPIKKDKDDSMPRKTIYLVDVHPLCYEGKKPNPAEVLYWMKLLFDHVSRADPVIAVMDGEKGNDFRRGLDPSYKKRRNTYKPLRGIHAPYIRVNGMDLREAFPHVRAFFTDCHAPVVKIHDAEADDVIATLTQQAIEKGMRVVVASPDMDFRQLLSNNVKLLLPVPEFRRWSFYTIEQYKTEHDCDPSADLSLRCMLGDQSDNIPGLPVWAPGFGRKTALKLMRKHGTLENLLLASQTRTVGKPYIQDALAQHRDALQRNLQILSLRRDVDVTLKDDWCTARDRSNDVEAFRKLRSHLQDRNPSLRR